MTATSQPAPRDRLIQSAARLVQERGVSGVGLREVVAHAQAARGSLQHYFPGGKTELIGEALAHAERVGGRPYREAVESEQSPLEMLTRLCGWWRRVLTKHGYQLGCPVVAVIVDDASTNEALRSATDVVVTAWQRDIGTTLRAAGFSEERAASLAALVLCAVEGAVILARAQRSLAPLDAVEHELRPLLTPRRRLAPPIEQQSLF